MAVDDAGLPPEREINLDAMIKVSHGEALMIKEFGEKHGFENPCWFALGQMYLIESPPQWALDRLELLRGL